MGNMKILLGATVIAIFTLSAGVVWADEVTSVINYQGRLADKAGSPLSGTYTIAFRLYEAATGGTVLDTDTHDVVVTDGLFNTEIDFDQSYFDGRALWLGITVGTDSEMTPRQEFRPVPYALSLVPGAVINGSLSGPVLKVNTDGVDSEGFYAKTTGKDSPAVYGYSVQDVGVYGKSESGFAGYFDGKVHVSDDVGIGTTDPGALLHVEGSNGILLTNGEAAADGMTIKSNVDVSSLNPGASTVAGQIANRNLTHLVIDVRANDVHDSFAVRTDSNTDGTVDTIAMVVKPTGSVGIGTKTPNARLHVARSGNGTEALLSNSEFGFHTPPTSSAELKFQATSRSASDLFNPFTGAASLRVDADCRSPSTQLTLNALNTDMPITFETESVERVRIESNGNMGIGTTSPQQRLHVVGSATISDNVCIGTTSPDSRLDIETGSGARGVTLGLTSNPGGSNAPFLIWDSRSGGANYFFGIRQEGDNLQVRRYTDTWTGNLPVMTLKGSNGNVGIGTTSPEEKLDVMGTVKCEVLKITGGADIAEPFDVKETEVIKVGMVLTIDPENLISNEAHKVYCRGMVLTIDPENPGKLKISEKAYDRCVAGIISGAGEIEPGMIMGQSGSMADGEYPVALTGRVYCWADALNAPIEPGDLLTTSDTPGYAMKVTDYTRAQGAVLGKAMSSLESGKGLVLVLVTLQ